MAGPNNPNNQPGIISGTDSNWVPQSYLNNAQELAKQYQQASQKTPSGTSGPFTAVSPWGVAGQMANALAGSNIMNRTGMLQKQLQGITAGSQTPTPYGAPATPPPQGTPQATSQGWGNALMTSPAMRTIFGTNPVGGQ